MSCAALWRAAILGLLLTAVAVDAATKTLAWDHDGQYTVHYTIYRSTDNGAVYTSYGQTPVGTRTFVDAAVPTGTALCYKVSATGAGGESGASGALCFSVPQPPAVPVNLRLLP